MTRPKVPPDQRQRTAQACESCKRRKQKCNGLQPCQTCAKRSFICNYVERDADSPSASSPTKAQKTSNEQSSPTRQTFIQTPTSAPTPRPHTSSAHYSPVNPNTLDSQIQDQHHVSTSFDESLQHGASAMLGRTTGSSDKFVASTPNTRNKSNATTSSTDEETGFHVNQRMLEDPTGRLLYIGDSATLSFLQYIRMMIENTTGSTPFTTDSKRHRIQETQFTTTSEYQPNLLPEMETALILIESFFTNTNGILQIFDKQRFHADLKACYAKPLCAQSSWVCILNLVFAIGLALATPQPNTLDFTIVENLRSEAQDRTELFYDNAKRLSGSVEDSDFWSVQAMLLMSFYLLAKAKRNASFARLHMAVASGYALGLHKWETYHVFPPEEQAIRRNTWRSLFVLDKFIACQLGRPMAILERDCNIQWRSHAESHPESAHGLPVSTNADAGSSEKLWDRAQDASIHACQRIGDILNTVYQDRKIGAIQATEIAEKCRVWPSSLAPELKWEHAPKAKPARGMAILHTNLLYCHTLILLTRPFFLSVLNRDFQKTLGFSAQENKRARQVTRAEKFSESCLIASIHTVVMIRNAFEASYLPRKDPFVVYFLLSASLILLCSEFAGLYNHPAADECIHHAISIMKYCGETDPHANRLIFILTSFRDLVLQQRQKRAREGLHLEARNPISAPLPVSQDPHTQKQDFLEQSPKMKPGALIDTPTEPKPTPQNFGISAGWTPLNAKLPISAQVPPHIQSGITGMTHPTNPVFSQPSPLSPATFSPTSNVSGSSMAAPMLTPAAFGGFSSLDPQTPLSSFMEFSALDNIPIPYSSSDDGSGGDEIIDFDTLWNFVAAGRGLSTDMSNVQAISDSTVPLFGVTYD